MRSLRLLLPLLLLATSASGAPVVPSGGEDGPAIQAAMNGGAAELCGVYNVGVDLNLVRNSAFKGCGPGACVINATHQDGILFVFNFGPGQTLVPGYFNVSGCTLNLQGPAAAFSIWSFGDYHDPAQTIYGIRLKDLQILGAKTVAVQIGRSMGTSLEDVYIQGGGAGVYCFDCGELFVSNMRTEGGSGAAFWLWGTGLPDDHWPEGAHFDKLIVNGQGLGLLVQNYGFVTGTHLDITTTTHGPALWLLGTVANAYFSDFDISGNGGQGGLTPQAGFVMSGSSFQRISLSHGIIYGSSLGAQISGTAVGLDGVHFTANSGLDVLFLDAHDSTMTNSRADSPSGPNVVEQAGSTGNAFINNVTAHGLSLTSGAIQHDNRGVTR